MRFRYVDAEGAEIEVASVDALKLRIGIGDVTPRTRLYDAAVGEWAPAREHKVFRFLVEEETDLLPEASRALMEDVDGEDAAGTGLAGADTAGTDVTAKEADRERAERGDGQVHVPSLSALGGGLRPRSGLRRLAWTVAVVLLLATSTVLFFHLREAGAGAPTSPSSELEGAGDRVSEQRPESEASLPPVVVAGDPAQAGGSSDPASSSSRSGVARGDGSTSAEAAGASGDGWPASLAPEVQAAASGDLARAMADLQEALGVPDGPPAVWLEGRYLAYADRHDEVREYWRAYGSLVASMQALEEELFRGFVQNRVLKMGLDTADAAGLSARILERYEASAEKRRVVYRDLLDLADEALALHDTLVARSSSVSHEPFRGRGLSRDPVVEAVADEPALAEHLWARLDRIFELLERLQGIRPVTTLRLQEALLGGLQLPELDERG